MTNAIQGMAVALIFSYLILLAYTKNFMQTTIAIFCVAYIMVSLICVMVLKNWEMGISESIAVVLLIGLSVDYVVHLAAHIVNSSQETHNGKISEAYREIGVSITSAAITTFGCGIFLFGGKNLVFKKFAILICSTIGFSYVVSMVLFGAMSSLLSKSKTK